MREQYGGGLLGSGTSGLGDVGSSNLAVAGGNNDDRDGHDDEGAVQPDNAGGFLTSVEDVIQPYSLPRPTHVVFSSPPRSPNTNSRASPAPLTVSPALAVPRTLLASSSSFPTSPNDYEYANDDDGEERAQVSPPFPVEDIEDSETDKRSVLEEGAQNQNSQRVRRIPKSMAALAAEVAEAESQQAMTAVAAAPQLNGGGEEATSTHARILRTATPRARAKTEPESRTRTRTGTRATTTARAKTTTAETPSRKRARTQDDDGGGNESASGRFGSESGSGCEEHVRSGGKPRVAKRARKHRQGSRTDVMDEDGGHGSLAPAPPSGRVLRTRKGKSPAQLAQEREQELAMQRALAG
jgi:xeroderma pigmentosum group C-complementing protein